jgi:menaquinone-dependent protoporphyrinogen IX oxidase
MNKTIIVYGSSTGTCEDIAYRIAKRLGDWRIKYVIEANVLTPEQVSSMRQSHPRYINLGGWRNARRLV